jgi:hypothetical protein
MATIVMDIDRHVQMDIGLRDRVYPMKKEEPYPLCAEAKEYYHKYVKGYNDDGHPMMFKICHVDAKKKMQLEGKLWQLLLVHSPADL